MNYSNTNFNSKNKQNSESTTVEGETANVLINQKCSLGHSLSDSSHKKPSSNQKINLNKDPSGSSKDISTPKISLLKITKSMSHMNFLSNNKNGNCNINSSNSNNNCESNSNNKNISININKLSNYKSSEKLNAYSSNKLRYVVDSQLASGAGLENKYNSNFDNNSFLNQTTSCELVSSSDKYMKIGSEENINNKSNHNLELYKDSSSKIEIREILILEKPPNQEDEEDGIYNVGFENIDNSNILNEKKDTIDISLNNFRSIVLKENPDNSNTNSNNNNRDKANEKNEYNLASLKEKKNLNRIKDPSSGSKLRRNRTRGFNNTFAKSLSPSKLTLPQGKLISEFSSILEVEENKGNSPDPKASSVVKNLVSFNIPTKMNLFCINKEKFYLVNLYFSYFCLHATNNYKLFI